MDIPLRETQHSTGESLSSRRRTFRGLPHISRWYTGGRINYQGGFRMQVVARSVPLQPGTSDERVPNCQKRSQNVRPSTKTQTPPSHGGQSPPHLLKTQLRRSR